MQYLSTSHVYALLLYRHTDILLTKKEKAGEKQAKCQKILCMNKYLST